MARGAAESILHGLLAALAVALILSLARVRDPRSRLRFWWLGLGCPVVLTPLFAWLCPARLGEVFRDRVALFSGERWTPLAYRGVSVSTAAMLVLAAAGLLLYLRDLVPLLVDFARSRERQGARAAIPAALDRAVATAAAAQGVGLPGLELLDSRHPFLSCRGLLHPVIVASRGLLELLSPDELDAAIAHEVAHAKRRDPALGFALMLLRGLFFFNPSVQLCARALTHESERQADQEAAATVGGAAPVVRSLDKLGTPDPAHAPARRTWHGLRLAALAERRQALLDGQPAAPVPRSHLAATAIGLGVILFLTVA